MNYYDYLKSAEWQQIARQVKERAGFRCQVCNSQERLVAHHRSYAHLGDETANMGDLVCLCTPCHERFHEPKDVGGRMVVTRMPVRVTPPLLDPRPPKAPAAKPYKVKKKEERRLKRETRLLKAAIQSVKARQRNEAVRKKAIAMGLIAPRKDEQPPVPVLPPPPTPRQLKRQAMIATYDHEADMPPGDPIVLTQALVDQLKTRAGAFTNASIAAFDIPRPFVKGWTFRLIGRVVSRDTYMQCLRGRAIYH